MVLGFENESASQTTDCTYLREQCLSDANGCKYAWRIMEDSCNVSGNPCKMKDSSNCNLSIQSLVESNFQFKDCLCTDNLYCTINNLLGEQCINESDTSLMVGKKSDCVKAAHICQESEHCILLYENFKKTCGSESEQCKTLDGGYLCATLRESLKETILWNCHCNDPSKVECIEIWKSLFEDVCIQDAQIVPAFSDNYEDGFKQDIFS
ncbi:hypothetical protein GH733_000471, partial [Mirounga leonina]